MIYLMTSHAIEFVRASRTYMKRCLILDQAMPLPPAFRYEGSVWVRIGENVYSDEVAVRSGDEVLEHPVIRGCDATSADGE